MSPEVGPHSHGGQGKAIQAGPAPGSRSRHGAAEPGAPGQPPGSHTGGRAFRTVSTLHPGVRLELGFAFNFFLIANWFKARQ